MKYTIYLKNLRFKAIVGILKKERLKKQKIKIDAKFLCDNLEKYLDYRDLRAFIKEAFLQEFLLLEDAQIYFLNKIPAKFPQVLEFSLTITKLEIFNDCQVGVKVKYKRS
ncbi:MAG: dihydroneopterin aldolase [Helicobacter sp.]|nr:dihydroneopterin aldolase [Helicobacter sp.]